ncbi:hypothetical protein [Gallaecimonas xiamenensis]|uniref:Lipoprotein n=1 Tax=Gallaecimonas xiamenensis 3-C-1 TaxID=745411 RepID=K2JKB6_9GAMM|nr:hypothetical protein [Gallaecimonas xiamenensis]EKE75743.1 hypothetical protein B3C1_06673 [Gallaecimonas xiamenensis 3-C-1]
MRFIILIGLLVLLAGCGPRPPDQGELQQALAQHLGAVGEDSFMAVEQVRLLDSQNEGQGRLRVQLGYELVFLVDFPEAARRLTQAEPDLFARFGSSFGAMALTMEFGVFRQGDRQARQQELLLVEDDGHWHLTEQTP